MKRAALFSLLSFLSVFGFGATISSKSSGGDWNTSSTWNGGVIPTTGDDVIINGAVTGNGSCNNLTVNAGASLQNQSGYSNTINVYGNIVNNGTITNNASSGSLTINAYGSITNNNIWSNYYLNLRHTANAVFYQSSGAYFSGVRIYAYDGNVDTIVFKTNQEFRSCNFSRGGTPLQIVKANGYDVTFKQCNIDYYQLLASNKIDLDGTVVTNSYLSGSARLTGDITFYGTCYLTDNIRNQGTIHGASGYSVTLHTVGTFYNEGTVYSPSGSLSVYIDGNLYNDGVYHPIYTYFRSNEVHQLSQTSNNPIQGVVYASEKDTIHLASDLNFLKGPFKGYNSSGYASIRSMGYDLTFDTCVVEYTHIYSDDSIRLNQSTLYSGSINGSSHLVGNFEVNSSPIWSGNITNHGSCINTPGYSVTVTINGSFTNYGNVSGSSLYIDLYSNLHNEGIYAPYTTQLMGGEIRSLSQSPKSFFQGIFRTTDTSDGIRLTTNCTFRKVELNGQNQAPYSTIHTNGHAFTADSCFISEFQVIGNDSLHLNGSILSYLETEGSPTLTGLITLYSSVVFHNGFTNLGTIGPRSGYSIETNVYGDLRNMGSISLLPNLGGALTVNIHDSIYNAGTYSPQYTYFMGNPTFVRQTKDVVFKGAFYTRDTSSSVLLGSDVTFLKADINFQNSVPYTSITTNNFNLTLDTCTFYDARIFSPDTLNLNETLLANIAFHNHPVIDGRLILYSDVSFVNGLNNIGIINNRPGYSIATNFWGGIENDGIVATNPSGGSLTVNINGQLHNAGTYHPNYTYTIGDSLSHFSQSPGTVFEGTYYTVDTSGGIKLASNVHFKKANFYWNNATPYSRFNTRMFEPHFDSCELYRMHLTESDSLNFNGSLGTDVMVSGAPILKGVLTTYSNVRFTSDVTVVGTIQNRAGYSITSYFEGHILNEGFIRTNPGGGSQTIRMAKGLENNGFYEPSYSYLYSNFPRSIGGRNINFIKGNFYVSDSMRFVNETTLPNLTIEGSSVLTIDTSSLLKCNDINSSSLAKIQNNGRILSVIASDQYYEKFYHQASARYWNNTDIVQLEMESYGHQKHPSASLGLEDWWRLKPIPNGAKDSLKQLNLYYRQEQLIGKRESDLHVFFSPNAGIVWQEITEGLNLDTTNNRFTLTNAPAYGHYILSDSNLGITKFKPELQRSEPRVFGNKGEVTIYGFGLGFSSDMKVSLQKAGASTIWADTVKITDKNGESFLAIFDADQADIGSYSIVVEVPDQPKTELTDYVTIEEAERPEPWVMLGGRNRFLLNRWQTFQINYGNKANTDALGVPLFFVVNDVPGMEIDFPDVQIGVPKSFTDDGWTQWQDTTIDLYFTSDSFGEFEGRNMRIYPFYIPSIGALSSNSIRVKVKANQDLEMTVWMTDPLIEGFEKRKKANTPPEVAACLAKAAAKYTWDKAIGLVPGYDCYKLAYKVTETGISHALKDPNEPDKPETWGSWLISGWGWAWSIADCAGDLIPVAKGVKIAKELIDIGFDVKSNYDANQECWDKFNAKTKGKHKSRAVTSFDPNEIAGPEGYTSEHYISADANMVYTVYFENKDTAQAPATDVVVLDTLDKNKFDLSTFSFHSVTIGDSTYQIETFSKAFRVLIDLAPRIQSVVQVTGTLDTSNGAIRVTYFTKDRSTLEPNEDVDLGFLPPNKTKPEGEGNFSYSVALSKGISHKDQVDNKALIFFDANVPIATNIHSNRIDITPPTSVVSMLDPITRDSTFVVYWYGTDDGCGLQSYNVFVSANDSPYVAWLSNTAATSDTFFGRNHFRYKFYCIASDSLGHTEIAPDNAQASTEIIDKSGISEVESQRYLIYPNPSNNVLFIRSEENETSECIIYSLQGDVKLHSTIDFGLNTLDVSQLTPNIYIIHISGSSGATRSKIAVIR